MKSYTELPGLEEIVLEESYVLGIEAVPGVATFKVSFVLTATHTEYAPPPSTAVECFRLGYIRFTDVQRLVWEEQGRPPATDASGEIDYGHIDSFEWDDAEFQLEGDWGRIELRASRIEVEIPPVQAD